MTQTPTNPEPDELDSALIGFANELIAYYERCEKNGSPILFIHKYVARRKKRMQALLEKEALKARAEELTHVQLEHGNYVTQTWFRLKAYTIKERIEQLTKQLGSK